MKRKTTFVAGVAAALVLALAAGAARAQAPGYTKVGFVNIEGVLQKYDKAKTFKAEMEEMKKPFKAELEKLQTEIVAWSKELPKLPDVKERERYEAGIVHNKRKIEDLNKEVQRKIGKRWEEQMVQLYKEVHTGVQGYAAANGYHAVFAYADPVELDPFSFPMIQRRIAGMSSGAAMTAFYVAPGLDITTAVADQLNRSTAGGAGAPVQGTPASLPRN